VKVTLLVPPFETAGAAVATDSARQLAHADALAEAIRGALSIDVPIVDGPLAAAPATGYLLAFRVPATVDPELARRIIAFDEDRATVMKRVEQHGFAGAVEKQRYFEWTTHPDDDRGYGLVGRKDVAARMPARITTGPYTSPRYGLLASDTARDLPGLIAEYLRAYDAP
jgi:hypothetical protein